MTYDITLETMTERPAAVVTATLPVASIGPFVGEAFGLVMQALGAAHSFPAGEPFASYRMHGDTFDVSAGFPVAAPVAASGRIVPFTLPGGTVATTMHIGPYDGVAAAYDAIMVWLGQEHLVPAGDPWEVYLDGPEVAMPRTRVCVPCRPAG